MQLPTERHGYAWNTNLTFESFQVDVRRVLSYAAMLLFIKASTI